MAYKLSLELVACKHPAIAYHAARWLLEAQRLPYRWSSQDIEICLALGLQAVILQSQSACGIVRYKIESRLDLARSSHVGCMANVSCHLLLIVASKRIKGIGNIVLGRKNVDA